MNFYNNLSFWEKNSWFSSVDYTIVGCGIVGLSTSIFLKEKFPNSKILLLERGILPSGASTKNAGFACFGSLSEILSDLDNQTPEDAYNLVKMRWEGLQLLKNIIGEKEMDFQNHGGYEIFTDNEHTLAEKCFENLNTINELLFPIFKQKVFSEAQNNFSFKKVSYTIKNPFEAQIDTGKMMQSLLKKAQSLGVTTLFAVEVLNFEENQNSAKIHLQDFDFQTNKLIITTNAFAKKWFKDADISPARAQVLITKPIENLPFKGTFHLQEGFYYFRNFEDRILIGGGRNLDFNTEETENFGLTENIQNKLESLLKEVILPKTKFEIEHRWSGIMAIGKVKKPIIKQVSENVFCGVRLGGMGVAIGSLVGKNLVEMMAD